MRHRKNTFKIGRTSSHNRALMANMLKSLIMLERLETTSAKAKELKRHADRMVTFAKKNTLDSKRAAISKLMIRFNPLTPKEKREVKEGKKGSYNQDRHVIEKLFTQLGPRFSARAGGYTRVIKSRQRAGDNAETSLIEFLSE